MLCLLCRHLQGIGGRYMIFEARWAYAAQAAGAIGGGRPTYLASFLKFWAVATSRTSSRAPLKPLSRSRSSFKMRFMCAKLSRCSATIFRHPNLNLSRKVRPGRGHAVKTRSLARVYERSLWGYLVLALSI